MERKKNITKYISRINEIHCLGNNSIIPGQRARNTEPKHKKYPGIMEFRDIIRVAIDILTPPEPLAEQYGLISKLPQCPRKHIQLIQHNLQKSLEAQNKGDTTLTDHFREEFYNFLMRRHGFNPTNEDERKNFRQKIETAKQVAQELRQETINQLESVINDPRLLRLTELQEVSKHGDPFTLLRRAFLADTDDKVRAEAIQMLALTDAALKIVLHREYANGTLNRIEEIMDYNLFESQAGKTGGAAQKIRYCIHDKNTLEPIYVADEMQTIKDLQKNSPNNSCIAMHPFPYRITKTGILITYSSRFKTYTSALAKYLAKNGAEKPRDQSGIRIIVQNAEDGIQVLQELHKVLTIAGLKPDLQINEQYTNYLFDEKTITYQYTDEQGTLQTTRIELPKTIKEPKNQHSSWNKNTSEVFQCDVQVIIEGQTRIFELRIVTHKQYLRDEYYQNDSHEIYVNRKRWADRRTPEEINRGYQPDNLFSKMLSEGYLNIINRIDRTTPNRRGIPQRRITNLADPNTAQRLQQEMASRIHKKNRRKIAQSRIPEEKSKVNQPLTLQTYPEEQLKQIKKTGKPNPALAQEITTKDRNDAINRRLN